MKEILKKQEVRISVADVEALQGKNPIYRIQCPTFFQFAEEWYTTNVGPKGFPGFHLQLNPVHFENTEFSLFKGSLFAGPGPVLEAKRINRMSGFSGFALFPAETDDDLVDDLVEFYLEDLFQGEDPAGGRKLIDGMVKLKWQILKLQMPQSQSDTSFNASALAHEMARIELHKTIEQRERPSLFLITPKSLF